MKSLSIKIAIIAILGMGMLSEKSYGQQDPLTSQYDYNTVIMNPAVTGMFEGTQIRAMHRRMWMDFPGGPITTYVTVSQRIKNNHGVGAGFFRDQTGPLVRMGGQLDYAFHMKLNEKSHLSLGVMGRIMKIQHHHDDTYMTSADDPALADAKKGIVRGDAGFGVSYYSNNLTVGLSATNLINTELDFNKDYSRNEVAKFYRHYYGFAGYKIRTSSVVIEPSILLKKIDAVGVEVDGTIKAYFMDEQLMLGATYRNTNTLAAMLGARFDRRLLVYFVFDVSTNAAFRDYSFGSAELTLGYDLERASKNEDNKIAPPPAAQ